jgi:hypothetical protein
VLFFVDVLSITALFKLQDMDLHPSGHIIPHQNKYGKFVWRNIFCRRISFRCDYIASLV